MDKLNLLLVCVLCFFISGCGNVIKNAPAVVATGTEVYAGHDAVVDIVKRNIDAFSPREVARLKNANDRMCVVKEKINTMVNKRDGNVAGLAMDLPSLLPLYDEAKLAYIEARTIISYRMHEFSGPDQELFNKYDATCVELDRVVVESLKNSDGTDNTETVKDIIQFIIFVGKIVIPLIVI